MQSGGYGSGGGVSEIQQFMVDGGCPASLFSISTPPPNASSSSAAEIQKFHLLAPHPHQSQPPPHLQPPQFAHFGHPIPITQQLFQQSHHHHHHHHQFQLFHHQNQQQQQQQQHQHHLGLEQDQPGQENSNSPAGSFLAAMNFKLGVDESSGGGSRDGLNDDDGILQGDDGSESRLHHHHHHHHHHNSWQREEESVAATAGNIKEPFWRPLDIDFISPSNKRPARDKQPAGEMSSSSNIVKHFKKSAVNESIDHTNTVQNAADNNYKLFSELEAICKPGGTPSGRGGGGGNNTNQTGSGSALTGDDNPLMPAAGPSPAVQHDNVSDTSDGGEAPAQPQPVSKSSSEGRKKRSKKKKQQKQLSSIAAFFETLVKQLMDHQEVVHQKFLEIMERRDQERTSREEAWRKQEAARASQEAASRAQERALAASRESAIIAFLEKITGESIILPTKAQFLTQYTEEESQKEKEHDEGANAEALNALEPYNAASANNNAAAAGMQLMSSRRWPKAEVQALIRVRSGFETRFQEPGLKGPLWEEVTKEMAAMGYCRNAKRCKEKWENINKYFRKTKDSGKKRPQHSKTCPYFHQLDQLYSSTSNARTAINSATGSEAEQRKDNSELLDAIVVANEPPGKRKAAEISNEGDQDDDNSTEEGQGESQGDDGDDGHRHLRLCGNDGGFHGGIRS